VVASNQASFVCAWVVRHTMVVPDVAIAPCRPPPRPRAYVPVGGHLIQHFATRTSGCHAVPAEHDHTDAVFAQVVVGVEEDRI
jgi:hypothetical protein